MNRWEGSSWTSSRNKSRARTRLVYLTSETRKGGGNLSRTRPSSAKHFSSVYLANICSLSTSVPGSSAPARPSVLLPCAPGGGELLPKCIRHSWGSSTAHVSPMQGEDLLSLEESIGYVHPCPSPLAPQFCYKEQSARSPHPWPLAFKGTPRCLCKLFSMNLASLPSPGGGVCFPESTGIPVCFGEGNHAGEGRKPQTALQEYFKLGFLNFIFFANCCWRKIWAIRQLQSQPSSVLCCARWVKVQAKLPPHLFVLMHGNERSEQGRDVGLFKRWLLQRKQHRRLLLLLFSFPYQLWRSLCMRCGRWLISTS